MFEFSKTHIEGVYIIEPKVFGDNRGYFMETYRQEDFFNAGITNVFVQDNESKSKKGVLRGLHYQTKHQQAKLVRVLEGEVFDVAVDLRRDSKTYGKYVGVNLSAENKKMLMVPKGFAHGFYVISETATFAYKCDDVYHPEEEGGIMWNDPTIAIQWPIGTTEIFLSEKDKKHPFLSESMVKL